MPTTGGGGTNTNTNTGNTGGQATPPVFESIGVPDWPPFGAGAKLQVHLVDPDADLRYVEATFARTSRIELSGGDQIVSFPVEDLGEGFGDVHFYVEDQLGGSDEAVAANVLIDLDPPQIEAVSGEVLPQNGGQMWVWGADAWVLGKATVYFQGGEASSDPLPEEYPGTLGEAWDRTLFTVDVSTLPAGYGNAVVVVEDAAGNAVSQEVPLVIDANAPLVSIVSPADGAVLAGTFQVEISARDPESEPFSVDIYVGGTLADQLAGASLSTTLDATEFAAGATTVEAVGVDRAGNRSEPATVAVTLQ